MKKNISILEKLPQIKQEITQEIAKVIIGQDEIIEKLLIALISNGHCLLEGVPGLAKTMMVSTMAKALSLKFSRIQFTPDLMPSDITGTDILAENKADGKRYFEYIKGPIFANVILADEINRTPPKTQAALLQAMQEYQVTAGNKTFELDRPFLVLATQNPIEQEGTYPLPEAQLDRFMFYLNIDYPTYEEEKKIVKNDTYAALNAVNAVIGTEEIVQIQEAVKEIPVSDHVLDFSVKIVRATRSQYKDSPEYIKKWVSWGAGPRASQYLVYAARSRAALNGRLTPSVDDVINVARIVLQHRIITSFSAEAENINSQKIITRIISDLS
ncbi:MAG: MoxR family ATPase [Candidatus Cloacimonetes bacterium]|nr:MoxR family ATPase [Candidatus Cloacimonadota bacterium]